MDRPVRYHVQFLADLAERVEWLREHRPPEQRSAVREALALFRARVGSFPGLGREIERRGSVAYCVRPLGEHLPYLIWYSYDTAHQDGPVSLLMLLHEAQDRDRFDVDPFEP